MITKEYLQQELAKRIDGYKRGVATTTDNIIAEMKSILVLVDALQDRVKDYDDALKRAKDFKNGTVQFALEPGESIVHYIFPELRESEDENLKNKSGYYKAGKFWKASTLWNATKDKIPQRVSNRYILQECTWNIGTLQEFADEIKNIQEVSLDYPIILDINGNILDGAHRVVKAYLEGKDIDIVYLGDDEWPEPDYDEEKSVRESEDERIRKAIIHYILYETKGNISEATEHVWVTWLEKQKEQNKCPEFCSGHCVGCEQKEQKPIDYPYLPGWRKNRDNNKPELKRSVLMLTTHGVAEGEWLGEKWCQYRWSCELKDGEVLYWIHLSDLERLEKEGEEKHKEQEHICDSAQYEEGFKTGLEIGLRKQRPAWSEEDEERVKEAIKRIDELEFMGIPCNNIRKVLQSLRPSWKPSEEQMKALENSTALTEEQGAALYSLIQDLKKL